ncbi:MAG: hypothetical protein HRT88_18150, partial [Lentisphaeraceae bacterium]|nr:hypothetical protein [Lentisphaeraceae bacterium]
MRLLMIFFISALSVLKANNTVEMISSANWPLFALNSEYTNSSANFIEFEETDFVELERQAQQGHEPIIPMLKTRSYSKHLLLNHPEIKWRYSMGFSAGALSGFSQSIGMSTALIKDELFFSADIA